MADDSTVVVANVVEATSSPIDAPDGTEATSESLSWLALAEPDYTGAIWVPSTSGGLVTDAVGSTIGACVVDGGTAEGVLTSKAGGSTTGVESTEGVPSRGRSDQGEETAGTTLIRRSPTDKDQA